MGFLPGKDKKVVGIPAPSTSKKARAWMNAAMGRFNANKRSFLGRR